MEKLMNPALFEEEMERKRLEENRRARILEITQDANL
jgi:hypothetical protein